MHALDQPWRALYYSGDVVCGVIGAGVAVVAAPVVIAGAGFTASGIAAGSMAAGMMSVSAPVAAGESASTQAAKLLFTPINDLKYNLGSFCSGLIGLIRVLVKSRKSAVDLC